MTVSRMSAVAWAAILAAGAAHAAEEKQLNVYNWSDYIAEDTVPNFTERTGVEVTYDVFDSNEVLEGKLLTGNTGYDLVVPTATFLENQIKAGIYQPLDKSKLTNWGNLDPDLLARVAAHDPDNTYSMPYMWGTNGLGYNAAMIEERMADAPLDSWDMVFKPEIVSQFADCGVTILDSQSEIVPIVLNYLGLDPDSTAKGDLKQVEETLAAVRPHIKYFHSSSYIDDLANGEICLAVGWSGDVFQAADDAAEGVEIGYSIPKEGTIIWFDVFAIPKDAPHPENAHAFLNYMLEPEVIAAATNYVWYANPNKAATEFVDEEISGDPAIYPDDDVMARLFPDTVDPPKIARLRNRMWTRVKSGQ